MPHFEIEPRHTTRTLLSVGIPSFVLAMFLSLFVHQYAHVTVHRSFCSPDEMRITRVMNLDGGHAECALASLAGPIATFCLACLSFACFMRSPRNLFFASLAFVNATIRLPETITVFLQLLLHRKAHLAVDESLWLELLRLNDPTIGTVLMCFFALTLLSLTATIVHDTRAVPWKWGVAVVLFLLMFPLERLLWPLVIPLVS